MRIQRRSLVKEIQAHAPLTLSEPVGTVQPLCNKLYTKPQNDWRSVESFLKLRQMRCEKSIALLHCTKKNCRIDQPMPRVKCHSNTKCVNSQIDSKVITTEMRIICEDNKAKRYDFNDPIIKNMNKIQDKSADDYQKYLSKYFDDSQIIENQHSFNLKKMTRYQLLDKLKNMNQNIRKSTEHKSCIGKMNKENEDKTDITLRSTVDQSNTETSPLEISVQKEVSTMQNRLKLLVQPQENNRQDSQKSVSLPYFSKRQLQIKLNSVFVTNQESEQNIQSDSKINSLIQNKNCLFSREMKRLRIPTEC